MERMTHIQTFADFWALVVDVWNHGYMGVAIGQIASALLILMVATLVRRLFSTSILRHLHIRIGRADLALSKDVREALDPPVRFVPIVIAVFIISEIFTTSPEVKAFFAQLNRSLVAFTIFWALFGIITPLFSALDGRTAVFNHVMISWAIRVGRILVTLIGGAAILEIWGIRVGPILAGLGLFGAAVALGAQDLFKNLIAGVFIIAERRFQNGDWILAENVVEGTVELIGLRTTKVRRFDLAPVYVPNAKLADNAVTNYSQMTYRRISWVIGLEYATTTEQLRQVREGIESYISGNADFMEPPAVPMFVRVDKFNDSSIDLMVYCFTRTTKWGEWLKVKEELTYAIKNIVEAAGTGFAFPSRSLYVETVPAGMEVFPLQQPSAREGPSPNQNQSASPGPGPSNTADT